MGVSKGGYRCGGRFLFTFFGTRTIFVDLFWGPPLMKNYVDLFWALHIGRHHSKPEGRHLVSEGGMIPKGAI